MKQQSCEITEGVYEGQVIYRLIGRKYNRKLLQRVPYIPYLDMAVIFYMLVTIPDYGAIFLLINQEQMEDMGLTESELFQQARQNTPAQLPAEFKSMQELMREDFPCLVSREGKDLYVLTNEKRRYGAAAILYDGQLRDVGRQLEEDFYVIPSSVHETLIVPVSEAPEPESMRKIVREINGSFVEDREVLSDDIYFYDRSEATLTKCL